MGFSDGISGILALSRSAVNEQRKLGWVELGRFSSVLLCQIFLQLLHVPLELCTAVLEPRYHLIIRMKTMAMMTNDNDTVDDDDNGYDMMVTPTIMSMMTMMRTWLFERPRP